MRAALAKRRQGDLKGAAALLEAELPQRPNAIGYYLLGETLLTLGDYRRGWPLFEFRWLHPGLVDKRAYYGRPAWTGQDLRGRAVLVQVEQGIGDVIMFARYLPWLKRLGARVLLLPRADMAAIARRLPGVDEVLDDGAAVPAFDFVVHLMGLPRLFGTTIDTIPGNVPYLAPDRDRASRLGPWLGEEGKPRIGLVWAGRPTQSHNHLRSIPLTALLPLLAVPDCRFYSLQKGPAEAELAALPAETAIVPLGARFDDLDDLVAAISRMDLVVSVCTGPAHIAGAMGKPVWTMIAEPPDLRWLVGRDDSPWYPTMRLFRQAAPGDWAGVVARVARELASGPVAWADPPARPVVRAAGARDVVPPEASAGYVTGMADLAETRQGLLMFDPDDSRVGRSIRHYGEWLHGRLELALRLVSPGGVVVEAGAGIGCHAVALGRALGADGRLLLYERNARRARMLHQNLAVNRIANATIVVGELGAAGAADAGVPRNCVDDFALERCDGIKADEDTDAEAILEGAQQTLWRCRPWLMLAADDEAALGRLAARVREFGYRAFRCATMLHADPNFYRRDDDVFDGASALALVALPEEADLREPPAGCVELA